MTRLQLAFAIIFCLLLSVIPVGDAAAQKARSAHWYFGHEAGLHFTGTGPVADTSGKLISIEGCAAISDTLGNLLFYTNGSVVWNKQHQPMPNGSGILGNQSSNQGALIVPMPGNFDFYYLFTTDANSQGFRYSVIDMSLDNGLGDITVLKNTPLLKSSTEELAATMHCNGRDYWVVTREQVINELRFHSYPVTTTGLKSPVISSFNVANPDGNRVGCLSFSEDGDIAAFSSFRSDIYLFDFDKKTGRFHTKYSIPKGTDELVYSNAISPDKSKLYTSSWTLNGNCAVSQFDLSASNITASRVNLDTIDYRRGSPNGYGFIGQLKLASDHRIYVSRWNHTRPRQVHPNTAFSLDSLDAIDSPNLSGPAAQFRRDVVYLNHKPTQLGLPNFVSNFTAPAPPTILETLFIGNDTTICSGTAFPVPLSIGNGFTQILWNTGETTRGVSARGPGLYWVSAEGICGTLTDTIRIYSPDDYDPGLPPDTLVCNSTGTAVLSVPQDLQHVRWSTGAAASSIATDTPGTYWMEALTPCGIVRDTVRLHFCKPEIRAISLSADSICEGACVTFTATIDNNVKSYGWLFAGGTPASSDLASPGTVCYPTAGVYPVMLIAGNKGGADTAESIVVVSARPVSRFKDTVLKAPYKSSITVPVCAAAQRVDWYQGDSLICANCPELKIGARHYSSTYRCVVRNGDCPDTCTYALRVIDIPQDVWLPDAFTPNDDGRNDIFRIITDNPNIEILNLAVYNRWGQHVFSSNRSRDGWDGKLKGVPAAGGTYFWQLSYRVLGEEEVILRKGDVLLVR